MKHIFKTLKSYVHKREFYYRMLLPYLILTLISIVLTGILGLWIIGSSYNKKIIDADHKNLQNIQTYTDESLYNNLLNMIRDHFLIKQTASPANFSLDQFFHQSNTTILEDSQYLSYLNAWKNANPLILSVTLYQKTQNFAISTAYGACHHPDTSVTFQAQVPFLFYQELATRSSKKMIFTSNSSTSSQDLLLLRSIPLYTPLSQGNGYIAVSIDSRFFLEELKSRYSIAGGFMIFNQEGELLLSLLPQDCIDPNSFINETQNAMNQSSPSLRFHQKKYSISQITSMDSGWTYVSVIPWDELTKESMTTFQIMGVSLFATVILSLIIVHRITSRIYHPLNTLRRKVAGESSDPNDLSAIQNAMGYLENQVDDMKQTIGKNKNILLYKTMMDLLYHAQADEDEIRNRLALCETSFSYPYYCIFITEFDPIVFSSIDLEQKEYIAMKSQEILKQYLPPAMIHMTESHPENRLITIMNLPDPLSYDSFLDFQKKLLTKIMDQIPIRVNFAFSPLLTSLSQIAKYYPKVCDYLKYHFLYGSGNIFSPRLYEMFESTPYELTPKEYGEIETLIRTGQFDAALHFLKEQEQTILQTRPSYSSVNSFIIQIYSILFRIGKERSIFTHKEKKQAALVSFQNASTFQQSMDNIFEILSLLLENFENVNYFHDSHLVADVIEHIHMNWMEDLTLTSLSEKFSISSSHLSRLFKQTTGENLSVFIIRFKLEKAAELLLIKPEMSVKDIGESLGYYSSAYFTKLFKDHYGITPSQYRRQHRSQQ